MIFFKLTVVITTISVVSMTLRKSDLKSCGSFYILTDGIADSGSVLMDIMPKTAVQCILKCISSPSCKTVNYRAASGRCQLISSEKKVSAALLTEKDGWTYMTRDEKDQNIIRRCEKQFPCKDNKCTNICNRKGYRCICDRKYCGPLCGSDVTDCSSVYNSGSNTDGVYNIHVREVGVNINVFCDMTEKDEGWIVIQRRLNDSVNFYRNWTAYKEGFGDLNGSMWIGLNRLHLLAGPGMNATLRVELKHYYVPSKIFIAEYTKFEVGNELERYKLVIDGYSGIAGDSMGYHNGMRFSTYDNDNDLSSTTNCASRWKGAWWYNHCHKANLNGMYPTTNHTEASYMSWLKLRGSHGNIIYSEMKIKYH